MSSTDQSTRSSPVVKCHAPDCEEHGEQWQFRDGRYCGTACEQRHRGRTALLNVLDHTVCGTCFETLKEVENPKPDFEFNTRGHAWTVDEDGTVEYQFFDQTESREAAVGFQYTTEHATTGEKSRRGRVVTGVVCAECGGGSHRDHNEILATHTDIARLVNDYLRPHEDVHVDVEILHREYEATDELALAVGRALLDDE